MKQDELKRQLDYNPATGVFTWRQGPRAGRVAGCVDVVNGHVKIGLGGRRYYAHRLAWLWMVGRMPVGEIDHADCNKANNAWLNLREASDTENRWNVPPQRNNQLGLKGVVRNGRRFRARINVNGRDYHLGQFD